jgi:hypothetical protein
MSSPREAPPFADVALLLAPIWGPLLLAPFFMLVPSLVDSVVGTVTFVVGLFAFPAVGLFGLLRTSHAGLVAKLFVGSIYYLPAMLFCGASFWGVCGVILDACKP